MGRPPVVSVMAMGIAMMGIVHADSIQTEENLKVIATQALPGTTISAVRQSEVEGLVEIIAGQNVLYLDKSGRYMVIGNIYDLQTATDVTADRKSEVFQTTGSKVVEAIPQHAVIRVGSGSRSLTIMHDPMCGYCRKQHAELASVKDVTVNYLLVPNQPGAMDVAKQLLCARDPAQALETYTVSGTLPEQKSPQCENEVTALLEENLNFARRNNLNGSPILIAKDGRKHMGYLVASKLEEWLNKQESTVTQLSTETH